MTKYISPFQDLINEMHKVETKENDYFKENSFCYLGVQNDPYNQYQWNREFYDNPFDDPNYKYPIEESVGWRINNEFLSLGVIANAGVGKTRLLKNLVAQYHKQGRKILVICPKMNEWDSAKNLGQGRRLNPLNKNERLPIVSYAPSFVEDHVKDKKYEGYTTLKYYSHPLHNFNTSEVWKALGLSDVVADYCKSLSRTVTSLKELKKKIEKSSLAFQSKSAAYPRLENIEGTKFINIKRDPLPLKEEWEKNNIVVLNYFSQSGFFMSADIWRVVEMAREISSDLRKQDPKQRILILFDDVNMYGDSSQSYNNYSIKSIIDCQNNYRAFGMDNIVTYQDPDIVDKRIIKGCQTALFSYFPNPSILNGFLPPEAITVMKLPEESGGMIYNPENYTKEWILKQEGKNWVRFFPEDCRYGHA